MILFVGDCPSPKMRKGAPAFSGADCQVRLESWISALSGSKFSAVVNSSTVREQRIIANLCRNNPFKVVALGQAASARLAALNIAHCVLPHPSGRNRLLNNADYVNMKLKQAKQYLETV
jgi:hypothetical protein